jgi:hypothetical protein
MELIQTKHYLISVGTKSNQIAIISKYTNEFIALNKIRKKSNLAKILKMFKYNISSNKYLFMEHITSTQLIQIKNILN